MATRTAPLFTATANARKVTLHLIDVSGDLFADSIDVAVGQSGSTLEAYAAAYAAASNASLYGITDTLLRTGVASPGNAVAAYRAAVESGINYSFKNGTTLDTFVSRLVAPITAMLQGNQDLPDITATEFSALADAIIAIRSGYAFNSAQYTGRRERRNNTKVK